jgi:hypothetical protein
MEQSGQQATCDGSINLLQDLMHCGLSKLLAFPLDQAALPAPAKTRLHLYHHDNRNLLTVPKKT